jgi:hypothetical protein
MALPSTQGHHIWPYLTKDSIMSKHPRLSFRPSDPGLARGARAGIQYAVAFR